MVLVLIVAAIITPPDILKIALTDDNIEEFVNYEFSDDPVMFNTIFDMEKTKTEEINEIVKANLLELLQQVETLHLENGSTTEITKKLLDNLSNFSGG